MNRFQRDGNARNGNGNGRNGGVSLPTHPIRRPVYGEVRVAVVGLGYWGPNLLRVLILMCGHTFLYSPPVRAVKDILDRQELGDIYFISASRVNLGLHQRDVSVVWDLGPHDFSILLYWLEEFPEWVRAVGRDSVVKGIS